MTLSARRSTDRRSSASRRLRDQVDSFTRRHELAGSRIVVAFSGGPDSTALLWALRQVARRHRLTLCAAHLDHAADPTSAERAARARSIAGLLDTDWIEERIDVPRRQRTGEGFEAAARRLRYDFLRRVCAERRARWIAVAHHRDDQAETLVLRWLQGTAIAGLGGMREVRGDILRPLLAVDGALVRSAVRELEIDAVEDPSNDDLGRRRNLVRHRILPRLEREPGFSAARLASLAAAARGAERRLGERLSRLLDVRRRTEERADLDLDRLRRLPAPLWTHALGALHRAAGAAWAGSRAARRDLARQVAAGDAIGCDCGAGWRWEARAGRLVLRRGAPRRVPEFSYTLRVPGELTIPESGVELRMERSQPADWMFRGSATRAALSLPLETGQQVLIRNRRPGDRLRPLGCGYDRKLKDVLIDRRVERGRRDALPLLVVDGRIAWVPGVTIEHDFRLDRDPSPWVAELLPAGGRI